MRLALTGCRQGAAPGERLILLLDGLSSPRLRV
jgi:hypothetical protein